MHVLDPAGRAEAPLRPLAPRPQALAGLTIGLLDNSKPNAGVLLERVAAGLAARWGAAGVRIWRKPGSSTAAAREALDEIARSAHVVLVASAD
jgi:hypothetical protein